jgi:biopolymer transport protein ExbB
MTVAEIFSKGGLLMYPIALCSFAGIAIFINKFLQYRRILAEIEMPTEILLKKGNTFLNPVIKGIMDGKDENELSIIATKQMRIIESGLSWLSLIANITPLLGLTGTVTGMINTFMVISTSANVSPSLLATGIWEALITTAAGLLVAIPIYIGHHYLEKQSDEIAYVMKEITMEIYKKHGTGNREKKV